MITFTPLCKTLYIGTRPPGIKEMYDTRFRLSPGSVSITGVSQECTFHRHTSFRPSILNTKA